jgi:hypothetical protein
MLSDGALTGLALQAHRLQRSLDEPSLSPFLADWPDRRPGAVIHHASDEPHSMQTAAEPLLAMYIWRSEQLNQKARLD